MRQILGSTRKAKRHVRELELLKPSPPPPIFEPIAIETLGVFNTSARQLLFDLGWKITESTGDASELSISKMFSARATFQCHIAS